MELDLHCLFGLRCTLYSLAETSHLPPSLPAFGLIYEGAIGQRRWTTPLCNPPAWILEAWPWETSC